MIINKEKHVQRGSSPGLQLWSEDGIGMLFLSSPPAGSSPIKTLRTAARHGHILLSSHNGNIFKPAAPDIY